MFKDIEHWDASDTVCGAAVNERVIDFYILFILYVFLSMYQTSSQEKKVRSGRQNHPKSHDCVKRFRAETVGNILLPLIDKSI